MSDDDGAYFDKETAATSLPPPAPIGILRSPSSFGDRVPSIKPTKFTKKSQEIWPQFQRQTLYHNGD